MKRNGKPVQSSRFIHIKKKTHRINHQHTGSKLTRTHIRDPNPKTHNHDHTQPHHYLNFFQRSHFSLSLYKPVSLNSQSKFLGFFHPQIDFTVIDSIGARSKRCRSGPMLGPRFAATATRLQSTPTKVAGGGRTTWSRSGRVSAKRASRRSAVRVSKLSSSSLLLFSLPPLSRKR